MLDPEYLPRFIKESQLAKKRGKNMDKLKAVAKMLLEEKPLPAKYCDHKLKGKYQEYRECHIEPDWLLFYKKTPTKLSLHEQALIQIYSRYQLSRILH